MDKYKEKLESRLNHLENNWVQQRNGKIILFKGRIENLILGYNNKVILGRVQLERYDLKKIQLIPFLKPIFKKYISHKIWSINSGQERVHIIKNGRVRKRYENELDYRKALLMYAESNSNLNGDTPKIKAIIDNVFEPIEKKLLKVYNEIIEK